MINNLPTLTQIHQRPHGKLSDRWDLYLQVYNQLLSEWREKPIDFLEIGVQNGGSLENWSQYFSCARNLVGCDNNPKCASLTFDDPRINVIIGDATDSVTVQKIAAITERLDVVIDDGSHLSRDIVQSFLNYFPMLKPGGIYIAEDLHCCYWREWGGGLCRPDSGVEFFKALCDCLNSHHWHRQDVSSDEYINSVISIYDCTIAQDLLQDILSIQFYDSICAIRKVSLNALSRIKERQVGGHDELVLTGHKSLDKVMPVYPQVSERPKSLLDSVNMTNRLSTELRLINLELGIKKTELEQVKDELDRSNTIINELTSSFLWRLTRPLTMLKKLLPRIIRSSELTNK